MPGVPEAGGWKKDPEVKIVESLESNAPLFIGATAGVAYGIMTLPRQSFTVGTLNVTEAASFKSKVYCFGYQSYGGLQSEVTIGQAVVDVHGRVVVPEVSNI